MKLALLRNGSLILPPLPKWPKWQGPTTTLLPVAQAITRYSPACTFTGPKDRTFVTVPLASLKEIIAWTLRLQNQLGGFIAESRDCDDFADAFDCAVSWMVAKAGLTAAPVVGCLSVVQHEAWAGVPAGGGHALNCVMTEQGLFIVEPQTGQTCPLETYPNRAAIFAADGF